MNNRFALYNRLVQLKDCKVNTKNVIIRNEDMYIIFQTNYDTVNVKIDSLYQFIESNKIKELELRCDSDHFNLISTTKIEELHIVGVYINRIVNWDKIIHCIKKGNIKRLVFVMSLLDDELQHFIELISIESLVGVEMRTIPLLSIQHQPIIECALEKNYHLLGFMVNINEGVRNKILYRNMSIRNEIMHFTVLDFSIALCSLIDQGFGPYVLLEIFDWIDWNYLANHRLKIRIIENVCRFRRSVKNLE